MEALLCTSCKYCNRSSRASSTPHPAGRQSQICLAILLADGNDGKNVSNLLIAPFDCVGKTIDKGIESLRPMSEILDDLVVVRQSLDAEFSLFSPDDPVNVSPMVFEKNNYFLIGGKFWQPGHALDDVSDRSAGLFDPQGGNYWTFELSLDRDLDDGHDGALIRSLPGL
jgi:hypothetical protein